MKELYNLIKTSIPDTSSSVNNGKTMGGVTTHLTNPGKGRDGNHENLFRPP